MFVGSELRVISSWAWPILPQKENERREVWHIEAANKEIPKDCPRVQINSTVKLVSDLFLHNIDRTDFSHLSTHSTATHSYFSFFGVLWYSGNSWPVNSPHNDQWRKALTFSLICAWINGWVNNREAGDLRRHRAHSDVIVMPRRLCNIFLLVLWISTSRYRITRIGLFWPWSWLHPG